MRKPLDIIVETWHQLTSIGANQDLEAPIRKRILLTNKISITIVALAAGFFFFWSAYNERTLSLINAISFVIFLCPLLLNAKKLYSLSRFFLIFTFNAAMFVLVGGIGNVGGIQITFYFLPSLGFILFGSKEKASLLFAILLPMTLFGILAYHDFKIFNLSFASAKVLNPYTYYYLSFGFIILSMHYLSQETQRAEYELSASNEKLQNSQIFLKSIIENLPLVFYTRDMENRYTLVNSEFEKLFSVKKSEVIFKTDSEIFSKSKVDFLVQFDEEVYKGKSSKVFEASIGLESEMDPKTFLCTKFPILGPHRETFGICGIALDISDRIEAQQQLDEQRSLVIDNLRLLALSDMANGMSHEINNPLATLTIIHGKLSRSLSSGKLSDEVMRDTLTKMQAAIQRIDYIVSALRKFIQKPIGERQESIDLKTVIDETLVLSNEKIKQSGIELVVKTTGIPFHIVGQSSEIRQVINSLVSNAFDAVANTPNATIIISTYYFKNLVKIIIQDNGPGVPKEFVNKVFQPFFTTKDVGKGQGLSLSVAKGIINSHRGKLIYDTSNELTTFIIELPKV
jgi:nitrogen-specific signal transduction histidine kinase